MERRRRARREPGGIGTASWGLTLREAAAIPQPLVVHWELTMGPGTIPIQHRVPGTQYSRRTGNIVLSPQYAAGPGNDNQSVRRREASHEAGLETLVVLAR